MATDTPNGPSYEALMQTGRRLFWKHGISRVSVTELCREAGVSKMTFYRYFSGKNALAIAVLTRVFEEARARYRDIMTRDIPFAERIRETVLMKLEGSQDISEELIQDIYQSQDAELMGFFAQSRTEIIEETTGYYREAQARGELDPRFNLEFMHFILDHMNDWVTRPEIVAMYPDPKARVMAITHFFFYGLAGEENPAAAP